MIISNPSRFKVEPHWKYWYFCIERWDLLLLRFSENAVLFHIEWLCRRTAGIVNQPPYRDTAVTHWACPASSGFSLWFTHRLSIIVLMKLCIPIYMLLKLEYISCQYWSMLMPMNEQIILVQYCKPLLGQWNLNSISRVQYWAYPGPRS